MEGVDELLNRQKQLDQLRTDLLHQGLTTKMIKVEEVCQENEQMRIHDLKQNLNSVVTTIERYNSPVSIFK